jgi:hypothetical protein
MQTMFSRLVAAGAAVMLAQAASASTIDLSPYVNDNVSSYTQGWNYPAPGPLAIGGVDFTLAGFGGGVGVIQTLGQGESYAITGLDVADAAFAYTIANSRFGGFGSTVATITFTGAGGASVTYDYTEGTTIRDHYYGWYNNIATDIYANAAFIDGAIVPDAPGLVRFDVQKFSLAPLMGQNLASITLTDTQGSGQAFLAAVTTAGAVPEPASWAMLIAGFGLVGMAARRRATMAVHA